MPRVIGIWPSALRCERSLLRPNPNLGLKAYCVEEGQIQEGPEGWDGMEVQKLCNTERVSSLVLCRLLLSQGQMSS